MGYSIFCGRFLYYWNDLFPEADYGLIFAVKEKPKPKTVELVRRDYQPTKAELEEDFSHELPDDLTFEELTKAMVQPVNVRWIDKPRKRRK